MNDFEVASAEHYGGLSPAVTGQLNEITHEIIRECREHRIRVRSRDFGVGPQRRTARRIGELRHTAATLFGNFRNWRHSDRRFSPKTLAARKIHAASPYYDVNWRRGVLHNPNWYRTADRRAAGVVSHDSSLRFLGDNSGRRLLSDWCYSEGLQATFLDDVLSWWDPGYAVVVVIEPISKS